MPELRSPPGVAIRPPRRSPTSATTASARAGLLLAAVVVALLVAACGGDDRGGAAAGSAAGGAGGVRPFSEVQAGPITFESDPNDPGREIAHVTTAQPMICAVVWGPDEHFGRFNNSLSMNGTGITQHDVLLPGVEAGATYRYVVQGTTADGSLYRSDVGSFQVPASPSATGAAGGAGTAATSAPPHGDNLALGATIGAASSEFSAAFAAARAIDGDTATEWATRGDGDGAWIEVDLGSSVPIGAVEFVTRSMADRSAIAQTFTVTVDGGPPAGPFPAATVARPQVVALVATGRRVRFTVATSSGGNVGAVEVRVFAP